VIEYINIHLAAGKGERERQKIWRVQDGWMGVRLQLGDEERRNTERRECDERHSERSWR
jgi:hypothetical protein